MLPVAADPDAVDQSLIKGMHRDGVPAGPEESGDVDPVVEVVKRISRRRPLRDENAVHIKFVIIIGSDVNYGGSGGIVQCECPPEKDVPVLECRINFRQCGIVELAVKHILRDKTAELVTGDPLPFKNVRNFFFHGDLQLLCYTIMPNAGFQDILFKQELPVSNKNFPKN